MNWVVFHFIHSLPDYFNFYRLLLVQDVLEIVFIFWLKFKYCRIPKAIPPWYDINILAEQNTSQTYYHYPKWMQFVLSLPQD